MFRYVRQQKVHERTIILTTSSSLARVWIVRNLKLNERIGSIKRKIEKNRKINGFSFIISLIFAIMSMRR